MKLIRSILFIVFVSLFLFSCGGESVDSSVPADLTGEWKQSNSNSEDSYQTATISGDVIEVYWVTESTSTKSLYWAGSFVAPSAGGDYSWDSANDTEKTSSALLASGDATKTFTYSDGKLSYSVSALGVTQTVELEKVN